MPLLAYCLAEARDEISFPQAGVQGMPLRSVRSGNLECLVSDFESTTKPSGTEYLRSREARYDALQEIAAEFRRAGNEWVRQWRDRDTARGLRCSALLGREHVNAFLAAAKQLKLPQGCNARVS